MEDAHRGASRDRRLAGGDHAGHADDRRGVGLVGEEGPLELEKSRGPDDQVDAFSQALNRLRAMVSLPKYSPPVPRPPTVDRRLDGVIRGSRSLRGKRFGRRLTDRSR